MSKNIFLRLHWKLYFPLVGLLWLIIGITICYFVRHERQRLNYNLESRLINVNKTVVEAYQRGEDLQNTTDFISMFVDHTTLSPIRITVYDDKGSIIADNKAATISIYDSVGNLLPASGICGPSRGIRLCVPCFTTTNSVWSAPKRVPTALSIPLRPSRMREL